MDVSLINSLTLITTTLDHIPSLLSIIYSCERVDSEFTAAESLINFLTLITTTRDHIPSLLSIHVKELTVNLPQLKTVHITSYFLHMARYPYFPDPITANQNT
mgnify:CR=1 FL=1